MEFRVLSKKEYSDLASHHELASFMQTIELANLKMSQGETIHLVGVMDKGQVVAGALLEEKKLLFHKSSFYSPRGFLIDYHDKELLEFFTFELKKYVKAHRGFRVIIDPNLVYRVRSSEGEILDYKPADEEAFNNLIHLSYKHFGFNKYLETMQVRYAYRLMLDEDYEIKKAKFSKSTRKNMEASYKKGLAVRRGTVEDLPVMEELFASTAIKKDFFHRDLAYYQEMYKYMGNLMTIYIAYLDPVTYLNNSKNLLAEEELKNEEIIHKIKVDKVGSKLINQKEVSDHLINKYKLEVEKALEFMKEYPEGKDVGCLLSLRSGSEYLTLTSGGLEEYHSFTPKYAMYDMHIRDAYKEGFKACNFYGISGNFERENNPLYGVYEFKKGFSGNVIEYIGQFTLEVTWFNKVYNLVKKVLGK
ncbi:MAG: peptidoglycan bridge formation glycyltransferase FemA/FemB family protein [Bacilli bacterium]